MNKKSIFFTTIFVVLSIILTACSSLQILSTSASSTTSYKYNYSKLSSNPVQSKLAVGILVLENTDLAVTGDQSKELLMLWKAVKSLSTDKNTTPAEIAALYQQIEDALTPQQVAAIQKLSWTQEQVDTLQKQYASQSGQSKVAAQTSLQAKVQSVSTTNSGAGGPPSGGPPGADIAMMDMGGPTTGQNSTSQTQTTSQPANSSESRGVNLNLLFVNPVIEMLQQHVNL